MGKERVIFSNRFDRPTLEQIEEEMKNKNYDDNDNLMSAEEFLEFMKQNRRTVPNEKRIANKDKFIWAVSELSETYEIDADLIEDDDGYTASLYMNYASYKLSCCFLPHHNLSAILGTNLRKPQNRILLLHKSKDRNHPLHRL